ncbi:hypothetical protein ElyMa_000406400 [Elysia marginata]|uniref:Reverse transcriptase domain-containing protein n=1 Tax=Elysia marginata TaxID=1093978 RepID=A0AAV4FKV4_9GAST|nr:hypothetical protein ElyMa_000406400 [Elysia marginata]
MRRSTEGKNKEFNGQLTSQLKDLDFADEIALLSHNPLHRQEKTDTLNTTSKSLGLVIYKNKTKILRLKTDNNRPVTVGHEELKDVESFTYLGSTINKE